MDKVGEGEEVQLADLPAAKELAFQGFGHDLFQEVGGQWVGVGVLGVGVGVEGFGGVWSAA